MKALDTDRYSGLMTETTDSSGRCPRCGGGPSHKKSFSVTRKPGGLAYYCFRASCGYSGFVRTSGATHPVDFKGKPKYAAGYLGKLHRADEFDLHYFEERFGINQPDDTLHIMVDENDAYAFPVRGPDGIRRGVVIRQPRWSGYPQAPIKGRPGMPKALTFMDEGETALSWYPPYRRGQLASTRPTVIVEDQLSALRCAQLDKVGNAVALLGTTLTRDKAAEIVQVAGGSEVLLALDPDAYETAFKLARIWGPAFDNLRVVLLTVDPKDARTDRELARMLGVF